MGLLEEFKKIYLGDSHLINETITNNFKKYKRIMLTDKGWLEDTATQIMKEILTT